MSLSPADRIYFEKRDTDLNDAQRAVITETFNALYDAAKARGVKVAMDDRAAKLEAAIVKFLLDSDVS